MASVEVQPHAGGASFRVRVRAGARDDAIMGVYDGALRIHVQRAPERGKANKQVLRVLARSLSLRSSQLEVVRGQSARDKVIGAAVAPDVLERRLAALLLTLDE